MSLERCLQKGWRWQIHVAFDSVNLGSKTLGEAALVDGRGTDTVASGNDARRRSRKACCLSAPVLRLPGVFDASVASLLDDPEYLDAPL